MNLYTITLHFDDGSEKPRDVWAEDIDEAVEAREVWREYENTEGPQLVRTSINPADYGE